MPVLASQLSNIGINMTAAVFSAVIIFVGIIAPIELLIRKDVDDSSGKLTTKHQLVMRTYSKVSHCRKCSALHSNESQIYWIVTILALVLMIVGIQGVIIATINNNGFNSYLIFIAFGVGIYFARFFLTDIISTYLNKLKL
ncbi:hypothetical protein ACFLV0_04995 [Chloroflexota bacterium]